MRNLNTRLSVAGGLLWLLSAPGAVSAQAAAEAEQTLEERIDAMLVKAYPDDTGPGAERPFSQWSGARRGSRTLPAIWG